MSIWFQNLSEMIKHKKVIFLSGNIQDSHYITKYLHNNKVKFDSVLGITGIIEKAIGISHLFNGSYTLREINVDKKVDTEDNKTIIDQSFDIKERILKNNTYSDFKTFPKADIIQSLTELFKKWKKELFSTTEPTVIIFHYADIFFRYKEKARYSNEEKKILLSLKKMIENISDQIRFFFIYCKDSLIPVEFYINNPSVGNLIIPKLDDEERKKYLSKNFKNYSVDIIDKMTNLTDGFYYYDLEKIKDILNKTNPDNPEECIRYYKYGYKEDPWGKIDRTALINYEAYNSFNESIRGQDHILKHLINALIIASTGLTGLYAKNTTKPKAAFFFAGPTGVGKTLTAKTLAEYIFKSKDRIIRFDMSEFQEKHSVAKLIGSPPGYVGYEEGGLLTNSVREKPFSVILFDEIEKAHPKILDIFLQILDEGRLTDSRGQTIYFNEAIIIFTSNLGTRKEKMIKNETEFEIFSELIMDLQKSLPLEDKEKIENCKKKIREHFIESVIRYFSEEISRPELLGRLGKENIIPFNPIIEDKFQKEIIKKTLLDFKASFKEKYKNSSLTFHDKDNSDNLDAFVEHFHKKYSTIMQNAGGRGIVNSIEREISIVLGKKMIENPVDNNIDHGYMINIKDFQ